jgi:hypothetical protein
MRGDAVANLGEGVSAFSAVRQPEPNALPWPGYISPETRGERLAGGTAAKSSVISN